MSARSDSQSETSRDDELLSKDKQSNKSNLQLATPDDYLDSEIESEDNWEENDRIRERVKSSDVGKQKSRRSSVNEVGQSHAGNEAELRAGHQDLPRHQHEQRAARKAQAGAHRAEDQVRREPDGAREREER